jgi:ABC-2 type transport system ATP-binding protein
MAYLVTQRALQREVIQGEAPWADSPPATSHERPHQGTGRGPAAIEMVDLCKRYGSLWAVDHLTLAVQQGEIFGLLGPNGSGKTTTVNMLSGLVAPSSGTVRVLGLDVQRQARQVRRVLGCVAQETALYEELTAWDNLDFHADLFGVPRGEKRARIMRILSLVQLHDRARTRVKTFSGGMKRRLAIGRALLHDPHLVYLDEPTLGVDVQSRRAIWDYILALKRQGKTTLITTNYLEEAQVLCDRLAIIDHGKLLVVDTPTRLKEAYGGSVIEVGLVGEAGHVEELEALPGVKAVRQSGSRLQITTQGSDTAVAAVINALTQDGTIAHIQIREPHLDEIFLTLTGAGLRD